MHIQSNGGRGLYIFLFLLLNGTAQLTVSVHEMEYIKSSKMHSMSNVWNSCQVRQKHTHTHRHSVRNDFFLVQFNGRNANPIQIRIYESKYVQFIHEIIIIIIKRNSKIGNETHEHTTRHTDGLSRICCVLLLCFFGSKSIDNNNINIEMKRTFLRTLYVCLCPFMNFDF